MSCYVGIDAGGSKTAIAVSDGANKIYTETEGAPWRERGIDSVVRMIKDAVLSVAKEPICGIVAGMPYLGESSGGDAELIRSMREAFEGVPVEIVNDVVVGWAGALALQPGVHLVAGTGSIAYARDAAGNSRRAGGWLEFFSDEGSAFWIARRTMQLFSMQSDGRLPKGPLYDVIREEYGLRDDFEFIDYAVKNLLTSRKKTATVQLLCEKAARLGDNSAAGAYREAADELCRIAVAARSGLDFPNSWKVSYSGGVFKAGELILSPLNSALARHGGVLTPPVSPPVDGALLMALNA